MLLKKTEAKNVKKWIQGKFLFSVLVLPFWKIYFLLIIINKNFNEPTDCISDHDRPHNV